MCGNSICQDRRFLANHMPALEAFFHYRNLDVSTLKELARRWKPAVLDGFKKAQAHTALADIHESIDELLHYRRTCWRPSRRQRAALRPVSPTVYIPLIKRLFCISADDSLLAAVASASTVARSRCVMTLPNGSGPSLPQTC